MTENFKKVVDKYIECGDKKEALAFGGYQKRSIYLFDKPSPTISFRDITSLFI